MEGCVLEGRLKGCFRRGKYDVLVIERVVEANELTLSGLSSSSGDG